MRITRLTRRDLVATLLVAAAMSFYAITEVLDVPGFASVRARAVVVFLLGMFACGAGAAADAFTARGVVPPIISVLSVLGFGTLVVGVAAIAGAGSAFLTGLVGGIALLWFGATLRHLTSRPVEPSPPASSPEPRELVKL